MAGGASTLAALAIARLCYTTLLEDGYKAKVAVEQCVSTKAVENIIEANTYLSGIGFESSGTAAAHAIHNGMTQLEECHHCYHGEKVAFGVWYSSYWKTHHRRKLKPYSISAIALACRQIFIC